MSSSILKKSWCDMLDEEEEEEIQELVKIEEKKDSRQDQDHQDQGWVVQTKKKKKKTKMLKSLIINCKLCHSDFEFSIQEQVYFSEMNFPFRKKCKTCSWKIKHNNNNKN